MSYNIFQAPTFWDCVASISRDDPFKSKLVDTQIELSRMPFGNRRLQTHDVGTARNGRTIYSSDVGGRKSDRRLVWQLFNRTIVLLLYGTHAVQDRAKRMSIDFDAEGGILTVYERAEDQPREITWQQRRSAVGRAFMPWTDAELTGMGFTDDSIAILRRIDHEDDVLSVADELGDDQFEMAFNLLTTGNLDGSVVDGGIDVGADDVPPATDADLQLEGQLQDPQVAAQFTRFEPEYLRAVLEQPIEDWMIFLHPDQRKVVEAVFDGPARVRGAAGTGKTVVALHRANELAQRYADDGRVLFVSFADHLVPVLNGLFARLPGARTDSVDFVSVTELASRILGDPSGRLADPRAVDSAFDSAHADVVTLTSPIASLSAAYVRSEVEVVIRGRGLATLEAYKDVARRGRRVGLTPQMRSEIWRIHEQWTERLAPLVTPADLILEATARARSGDPRWRSAIVDEAQDLTMAGLGLIRAAVNGNGPDRQDSLLLCGDGAQKVLPGGFTLRQAGVEVRGRRTTVLRENYRTTEETMDAALLIAGTAEIVDLDEEFRRGEARPEGRRHGPRPELHVVDDEGAEISAVVSVIQRVTASGDSGPGDIGVLSPPSSLEQLIEGLVAAGQSVQRIPDYDGTTNDFVKVGAWSESKGLEFKVVVVTGCGRSTFPSHVPDGDSDDELSERRLLELGQMFVAMTRARDQLILTSIGPAAAEVESATSVVRVAETEGPTDE